MPDARYGIAWITPFSRMLRLFILEPDSAPVEIRVGVGFDPRKCAPIGHDDKIVVAATEGLGPGAVRIHRVGTADCDSPVDLAIDACCESVRSVSLPIEGDRTV